MKSLLLALALSFTAAPVVAQDAAVVSASAEADLLPVAAEYVDKHRFWMPGTYEVVFTGREGNLLVYTAVRADAEVIKQVMVDALVEQYRGIFPQLSEDELRAYCLKTYAYSEERAQGNAELARSKRSFQILVDPESRTVTGERPL